MNKTTIRQKLLEAGVHNLQEFGYPYVTVDNILTDVVYSEYFASMLENNIGLACNQTDEVINELLSQINNSQNTK